MDEDGYFYIRVNKGMHGIKQDSILAYTKLVSILKPFGYRPILYTVEMWQNKLLWLKIGLGLHWT